MPYRLFRWPKPPKIVDLQSGFLLGPDPRIGAWLSLVERCVRDAEVEGSNPFAPTILRNQPFGEYVEGLSYCGAKSYVIEDAVQKHDFEDLTFFWHIGGKPFVRKTLRSSKTLLARSAYSSWERSRTSSWSFRLLRRSRSSVCFAANVASSISSARRS